MNDRIGVDFLDGESHAILAGLRKRSGRAGQRPEKADLNSLGARGLLPAAR